MHLTLRQCLAAVHRLDRCAPPAAKLPRLVLTGWLATLWIAWLTAQAHPAAWALAVLGTVSLALVLKYALAFPLWVLARWHPERVKELFLESGLEWPRRPAAGPK